MFSSADVVIAIITTARHPAARLPAPHGRSGWPALPLAAVVGAGAGSVEESHDSSSSSDTFGWDRISA